MSTYDFLMLSQIEQLQAIMTSSKFLQKKVSLGSYFELHSLRRFYIEIEKEFFTKRILNISIFSEGTKLDKYVGEIAL